MLVDGDAADGICDDVPRTRILDVCNSAAYVGFDVRILEHAVAGSIEGAILKNKVADVTKWLFASNVATDKS